MEKTITLTEKERAQICALLSLQALADEKEAERLEKSETAAEWETVEKICLHEKRAAYYRRLSMKVNGYDESGLPFCIA